MIVFSNGEYTVRRMAKSIGFALYRGDKFMMSSTSLDYLADIVHYQIHGVDEYTRTYLF